MAFQDTLIGSVAPTVIVPAFVGSGILYALGGNDKQARRLVDRESAAASRSQSSTY